MSAHLRQAWAALHEGAASLDRIMSLIIDLNVIDVVRELWNPDYSAGDLMTDLDYEVEIKDSQLPELRQRFQSMSQNKLRSLGFGPRLTVWRAGNVYPNMPMPTTLYSYTAETFKDFRGRGGEVIEYDINLSDVLYYSEAIQPYGSYAEEEIGVMGRDLQNPRTANRTM